MTAGGTAFVTGGTGFVGQHLVNALVRAGWTVRCLVRRGTLRDGLPDGVESVTGDLSDRGALAAGIRGASTVFHLAAVTSSARRSDYERVNVAGTRRVLEAVAAESSRARLVLCSSLAAVGPSRDGHPLSESTDPAPVSAYGESKLSAELAVTASGLDSVTVRPPAVYGPGDHDILAAFRLAARGFAIRVGPADQRLSMIHVADLATALILAADARRGRCYHVSDGFVHRWHDVVTEIGSAVGRTVTVIAIPRPVAMTAASIDSVTARMVGRKPLLTLGRIRELSSSDWSVDMSRSRRELGFEPAVTLHDGMRATAEWYQAHALL